MVFCAGTKPIRYGVILMLMVMILNGIEYHGGDVDGGGGNDIWWYCN